MKTPHLIKLYKAGKAAEAGALIESGVDINLCTAKGKTALMYAGRSACTPSPCRATDNTRSRYNGSHIKRQKRPALFSLRRQSQVAPNA